MIDIDARLRINALLDRLVEQGDTFPVDVARDLVGLVPMTPPPPRMRVLRLGSRKGGFRGHAAGVGDVEVGGTARPSREWLSGAEPMRIGGYKVSHVAGNLVVELMWADTNLSLPGQVAVLRYDKATGEPARIDASVPMNVTIPYWPGRRFNLSLVRFGTWKLPEPAEGQA